MPHPEPSETKTVPSEGDINRTFRDSYPSLEALLADFEDQPTVDGTDESYHCDSGDMGFRVYLTDLPEIQHNDIESGLLLYRPDSDTQRVYELTSDPYETKIGGQVDVTIIFKDSHSSEIRTIQHYLRISAIVDEMTYFQKPTVQTTLSTTA